MLGDIIRKEILDSITSPKFVFTFILCTILILLAVYTGVSNYLADKKEYAASVALNRKVMEGITDYLALRTTMTIYRPPQVLGAVVNGVEEAVGRAASLASSIDEPTLDESKYESNPVFALFGALDLMFVVKIVLSLMAILFTYDSIVGEKERGTLKLALSNNVPRSRLILGKAIGSYLSLLLPLLVPLTLSLLILLLVPNIELGRNEWMRLGLIFLMFLIYLSVFFCLGLFVSARTSRSSTSFLVLLFIWVVFVMVIPRGAVLAASQIKPIPSVHEITTKKREFSYQASKDTSQRLRQRMSSPDINAQNSSKMFQEVINEGVRLIEENNKVLERDYQLRKAVQQSLAVNLSRISPASALTFGSMSLARTGVDECDQFLASVRVYQATFEKWYTAHAYTYDSKTRQRSRPDVADMPQHSSAPESLKNSLYRSLPDFALMLGMILVFFAGAYVSFLRYDVR